MTWYININLLLMSSVSFDFIVSAGSIRMDPAKEKEVVDWLPPESHKELKMIWPDWKIQVNF